MSGIQAVGTLKNASLSFFLCVLRALCGGKGFWLRLRLAVFIIIGMDERDFYDEKDAKKSHTLNCPHCREANEYELSWLVRTKKKQLPGRADERDRAKFAKARTYMVRRDDMVMCKNMRCRKRFEVAGVQSVAFID